MLENFLLASFISNSLTEVAARVDSKSDLCGVIVDIRSCLCLTKHTGLVGVANVELIVVSRESGQVVGFNLVGRY